MGNSSRSRRARRSVSAGEASRRADLIALSCEPQHAFAKVKAPHHEFGRLFWVRIVRARARTMPAFLNRASSPSRVRYDLGDRTRARCLPARDARDRHRGAMLEKARPILCPYAAWVRAAICLSAPIKTSLKNHFINKVPSRVVLRF